jgi:phosphatidylglycerophosphate synthase
MFVEPYLKVLKAERHTPAAFARYIATCVRYARAKGYENPDGVRSVLVNALGFFFGFMVLALALAFWVDGEMARRLVVRQAVWFGLGTVWILAHISLLRSPEGKVLSRFGLPNQISYLRLLLIPTVYHFIVEGYLWLAVAAYMVAGVSDVLDGFVARRLGAETRLGRILDPLVDVGYVLGIFGGLYAVGWVPTWLMVLVWVRYALLIFGATFVYLVRFRLAVRPTAFGRASGTVVQAFSFFLLVLGLIGGLEERSDVQRVLVAGIGALFVAACVQLIALGVHNLRGGVNPASTEGTT